jgi:hypothetical protein
LAQALCRNDPIAYQTFVLEVNLHSKGKTPL